MSIIYKLNWRYATKKFNPDKKLSSEKLEVLKEAFNLTAMSFGLQPVRLVLVASADIKNQLLPHAFGQKQVTDASHVLVFCIQKVVDKKDIISYFNLIKSIRNTPDEILNKYREAMIKDFENKTETQIEEWATKQAYLAMGNLLTVCAVEEIDACPMEGFLPDKFDDVLGLSEMGLRSVLVMPVGYRADDDMFAGFKKVRKEVKESIIEL